MESDKNTLIFSITDLFDARRELYEKQKMLEYKREAIQNHQF